MNSGCLLGLDLGTTNVKALVVDAQGQTIGKGSVEVRLYHVGTAGVEQDLAEIWTATRHAIQQAINPIEVGELKAIGISSQGGAMQMLDAQSQPMGRVISWLDGRGTPADRELTRQLGVGWFESRVQHLGSGLAIGQCLRLRREPASGVNAFCRVGFVGDLVVEQLCGKPVHDGTSAALTLLYNPLLRDYDPDVLAQLNLSARQLPFLQPARSIAGRVSAAAAAATGLPVGLPVSGAIHDQYASALGIGAVHDGDVMFGTGTAWVLLAISSRLIGPLTPDAFVCHHVVDRLFGQILSMRNGGSAVQWALQLTGQGKRSVAEVDQLISSVKPGSDGLRCWPFLAPTDPVGLTAESGGRLDHLRLSHTAAAVARAVVEGLALELNRFLTYLRRGGFGLQRLIMTGGAASSQVTPQIIADVTGLPVACTNVSEGSLWGAVVLARSLIDEGESLEHLSEHMALPSRSILPGADQAFYQEIYQQYSSTLPGAVARDE
jgi:xylulokinase